jgi:hypothetical protein
MAYSLGNQQKHTAVPMLTGVNCLYFSVLTKMIEEKHRFGLSNDPLFAEKETICKSLVKNHKLEFSIF